MTSHMWSLSELEEPTQEPLTIQAVQAHLRIGEAELQLEQDGLLRHIVTARRRCEHFTRRQLLTATWNLQLDSWWEEGIYRDGALFIPRPPLASVTSVKYIDSSGVQQTWDAAKYQVDKPAGRNAQRGRICPAYGEVWPSARAQPGAIAIEFVAGWTDPIEIPAEALDGMLLVIGELYEHREDSFDGAASPAILSAEALWWGLRAF